MKSVLFLCLSLSLGADALMYSPSKILFFHPQMLSWHFGVGSFFRKPVKTDIQAQEQMKILREKLDALDLRHLTREEKERLAFQERLAGMTRSLEEGPERIKSFSEAKEEYREEHLLLQGSYEKARRELLLEFFLSREEVESRLKELEEEIQSLAQAECGEGDVLVALEQTIRMTESGIFQEENRFFQLSEVFHPLRSAFGQDFERLEEIEDAHRISLGAENRYDQVYLQSLKDFLKTRMSPPSLPVYLHRKSRQVDALLLQKLARKYEFSLYQRELLLQMYALEI